MSKTYKGYELIKAIADGEIKEGQQFNVYKDGEPYFSQPVYYKSQVLRQNGTLLTEFLTLANIVSLDFKLIEDEIDIDNIEEMTLDGVEDVTYFVNDLIKAVKQLNKEIKSIKEK